MRDFFERQEQARRNTTLLALLFAGAVVAVVGVIHASVSLLALFTPRFAMQGRSFGALLIDPAIYRITVPATLLLILAGTLYKFVQLRHGGPDIATRLGGRQVAPDTMVARERQLLNVVEEMAIAAGMPVPLVYILDQERSINAFAAGFTPADAVVAVTDGALELLSRDELQGVIAHECGHILSGDTRLNLKLMGMVHGILLLHLTGAAILRGYDSGYRARRMKDEAPLIALALTLYIVGFVGGLWAKLIKMAVSRQREYLSDATAVQLTRNPQGLAEALKKIGGLTSGGRLLHPRAEEASHMYFESGMGHGLFDLFSTHPPLEKRILLLDPSFDGTFPRVSPVIHQVPLEEALAELPSAMAGTAPQRWESSTAIPQAAASAAPLAADAATTAKPQGPLQYCSAEEAAFDGYMRQRRELLDGLAGPLRDACRRQEGAQAVMLNLLFSGENETIRTRQWEMVRDHTIRDRRLVEAVEQLWPMVQGIQKETRLPLVDLCLPALRTLPADRYQTFRELEQRLVEADNTMDLFEYVVHRILLRNLEQGRSPRPANRPPQPNREEMRRASTVLLASLAHHGHQEPEQIRAAFAKAMKRLPKASHPGGDNSHKEPGQYSLTEFDQALTLLSRSDPSHRRLITEACLDCLGHDGKVTTEEAELFRAIVEGLEWRIPPWLTAHSIRKREESLENP